MVKGFVKTLEASLAIVFIFISMIFLFPYRSNDVDGTSDITYLCLKDMDNSGYLRHYASNNMEAELNQELGSCIPSSLNFTARICTTSDCSTQLPSGKNVYLSSYVIAGDNSLMPALIDIWVWSE